MILPKEDQLQTYDYELPSHLIAAEPVIPRDASRLLVLDRQKGSWSHHHFRDLPQFLTPRDLLVANNTRVMKARLLGHRFKEGGIGGKIEFFLLEKIKPLQWEGLYHGSAKATPGLEFLIPLPDLTFLRGKILSGTKDSKNGTVTAEFDRDPLSSGSGMVPLPPYIRKIPNPSDEKNYQTVYAKSIGSTAVPTAGLHFTPELLDELRSQGIGWDEITLHTGLGTFRPVKTENIRLHPMHEESFEISEDTAKRINDWKRDADNRIVAVGTTSVRALESAWLNNQVQPGAGRTSLFISPGHFEFRMVDHLITNFHFPQSTLLMLVSAFAGRELILDAYADAVREKYRFFSYGDAMLIL